MMFTLPSIASALAGCLSPILIKTSAKKMKSYIWKRPSNARNKDNNDFCVWLSSYKGDRNFSCAFLKSRCQFSDLARTLDILLLVVDIHFLCVCFCFLLSRLSSYSCARARKKKEKEKRQQRALSEINERRRRRESKKWHQALNEKSTPGVAALGS